MFGWESDLRFLSKSGIWTEIEIKISRSDFHADLINKTDKHRMLADAGQHKKPNLFFYAVPEELVRVEEIPEYAGLLAIHSRYNVVRTEGQAGRVHCLQLSIERFGICRQGACRYLAEFENKLDTLRRSR